LSAAGVVAALELEARTLGSSIRRGDGLSAIGDGTLVAVSGMGYAAAAAAATTLAEAGAVALVSWGMAGGLDPTLRAGTICIPTAVISRDGATYAADINWRELVGAAIAARHRVVEGTLLSNARVIDDIDGKAAAFRDTGAVAVDMESVGIADIAAKRGLPFIAVRAIVDTAGDALPGVVLAASVAGHVSVARLIVELLRTPADIGPLVRLGFRYRAAARALRAVAVTGVLAPLAFATTSKTRIAR
jgi:hopanoid-associated phosphorylase